MAPHRIRQQTLDIDVESEAVARTLQPRMSDINRRRFLPVIERVLGEFDIPGLDIKLDALALDLGELPLEGFEDAAERQLARVLREAMARALREAADDAEETDAAQPGTLSQLDALEHYLIRGTLPFGHAPERFSAEASVLALCESEPGALAEMLRRHAGDRQMLERLVLQLSDAALSRLLQTLEPEHAALILAYMWDLRASWRVDPPLPLAEPEAADLLWVLTLSYVLNDPGTRFNRKAYVRALLEGVSQSERIAYETLIRALGQSLQQTAKRHSLASSLPAIVDELLQEVVADGDRAGAMADPDADVEDLNFSRSDRAEAADARDLSHPDTAGTGGRDRGAAAMPPDDRLSPHGAHAAGPSRRRGRWPERDASDDAVSASESGSSRLAEIEAAARERGELSKTIAEPGGDAAKDVSEFALERVADAEASAQARAGLSGQDGIDSGEAAADDATDRRSSARDKAARDGAGGNRDGRDTDFAWPGFGGAGAEADARGYPTAQGIWDLAQESHAVGASAGGWPPRAEQDAFAHLTALEYWLTQDSAAASKASTDGDTDGALEHSLRLLLRADPHGLAAMLRRQRHAALARLVEALDEETIEALLAAMGAGRAQPVLAMLVAARRWHRLEPLRNLDGAAFARLLWLAGLQQVLSSSPFDAKAFVEILVGAIALAAGRAPRDIVRALRESEAGDGHTLSPAIELASRIFLAAGEARPATSAEPAKDAQAWLVQYLAGGEIGFAWRAADGKDTPALLRLALEQEPADAAAAMRAQAQRGGRSGAALAARLLATLDVHTLLGVLAPGHEAAIAQALRQLIDMSPAGGPGAMPAWTAAVAYLLETPPERTDLRALSEHAAQALAARGSTGASPAAAARRRGPDARFGSDIPRADFRRYDRAETARYLLRHGMLPWSALLREPELSVQSALAVIASLPPAQLRAVFAAGDRAERRVRIARAAQMLSEEQLLEIVLRLLAQTQGGAAPVRDALLRGAGRSGDRRVAYARLLDEIVEGRVPDAETLARLDLRTDMETAADTEPSEADEPHIFKSRLTVLLRSSEATTTADRETQELVEALIAASAAEAAEFLRMVAAAPELRAALLRRIPEDALRRVLAPLPRAVLLALRDEAAATPGEDTPSSSSVPSGTREAIFAFLGAATVPVDKRLNEDGIVHGLVTLLDTAPEAVAKYLQAHGTAPAARARWVGGLPDAALTRLSHLLEPTHHRALLSAAETLAAAWRAAHPGLAPNAERDLLWSVLFDFLAESTDRSVAALTAAFLKRVQGANGAQDATFLETARRQARLSGQGSLVAALSAPGAPPRKAAPRQGVKPRKPGRGKTAFGLRNDDEDRRDGAPIYILNAGLVLTNPFLPHLFSTLDLTMRNDKGKLVLRDAAALSRAVHLLQYLADGRCDAPEPLLVLNKILCGAVPQAPVARAIEMTEQEREICDRLLKAMTQNWTAIKNTSVAGLRETFLQREGKLERAPDRWKLTVQRKTLDVLVDQIPWAISMIYHGWMPEPIYVTW